MTQKVAKCLCGNNLLVLTHEAFNNADMYVGYCCGDCGWMEVTHWHDDTVEGTDVNHEMRGKDIEWIEMWDAAVAEGTIKESWKI